MATTQYIGARYVPVFADPAEWTSERTYEPLTIVLHNGNSYTSKQYVPIGIDIDNEQFWAETGNYNAQVEAYRREVLAFDGRITDNAEAIAAETEVREEAIEAESEARTEAIAAETNARIEADTNLQLTLGASIDAIRPRTISNRAGLAGTVCMVFGDSFTDSRVAYSEYGQWPNAIRDAFGFDMRNYGVSGSGIVHGNANLLTQIQAAVSNMSDTDKANTSVIIMYYGYNDISNNRTDGEILSNYRQFVQLASANYPNARIIAIPFNYGSCLLTFTREVRISNLITEMRRLSAGYPVEIIDNARFWLLGQFSWFKDSVHPNEAGYIQITTYIANAILGAPTNVHRAGQVTLDAGVASYKACQWVQDDGLVHVYARFVPEEAVSTPTTTVLLTENEMPPIMCPELLIQRPTGGVNATGLFAYSSQVFRAYQYTVPNATTALIFNETIRAAANKQWSA